MQHNRVIRPTHANYFPYLTKNNYEYFSLSTSVVVFPTTSVWVFLHLSVAFTTTSVWIISTSVWLHLYPCTVGPSVAVRFEQFLVDLWVSPTLFVGFLFFQWVVLQLAVLPVDLWVSPTLFVGFLFF